MKTNTFIFNFINQSRLVYLLPVEGSPQEPDSPEDKKEKTPRESLEDVEREYGEAWREVSRIKKRGGAITPQEIEARAKFENAGDRLATQMEEMSDAKKGIEYKWVGDKVMPIATRFDDATETTEKIASKEQVDEILKNKKDNLVTILAYFSKEGYGKGDWGKYNIEILNILDKKNESSANKKKWIEAFQEWAGTGGDGRVGPNTMLALAKKMNMSEYERKIERTMIAKKTEEKETEKPKIAVDKAVDKKEYWDPSKIEQARTTYQQQAEKTEKAAVASAETGGEYYDPVTNEFASFPSAEDVPQDWVKATKEQVAFVLGEEGKEEETAVASVEEEKKKEQGRG